MTGASTGIGRACARELSERGFRVFAGVRKEEDAESVRGDGLEAVMLDVTDADAIARARETIDRELGDQPLAGIVNNAGVGVGGPMETLDIDDLRQQFEINTIAPVAVAQAFIPRLRRSRGRIVNMSSIGGRIGQPFLGPYSGSKFALEAISDAMRCELMPWGIHIALIEPGNVSTPIWDKGMARLDEVRASATPETRELYGRNIDRMEKLLKLADKRGVPPEKVARSVVHAMTSSRPRTRYLVGADARMQLVIDRALPTRVTDRLFSKIAGS